MPDRQNVLDMYDGDLQMLHVTNPDSRDVSVVLELRSQDTNIAVKRNSPARSLLHVTFDGRYAVTNGMLPGRISFWDLYPQSLFEGMEPQ